MNRAPTLFARGSPFLFWMGGSLVVFGAMWLLLMVREYHIAVFTEDATPNSEAAFWTQGNLIGVIASAVSITIGTVAFLLGCARRSRSRHHGRRDHSHSTQSTVIVPAIRTKSSPPASTVNDDGEVSFDMNDELRENHLPADTPGAPIPHGKVRVRVKRRIKMRIRKPNE